ncbi:divergent polysaccharide deacetylase family protein, partial [Caenispirillum bisanense]|uniref:divergent polysaccharide deacetylase family protein n=1 Tax=Caenispirillum bisanense TaxID=414052 RepID=UPI0031D93206
PAPAPAAAPAEAQTAAVPPPPPAAAPPAATVEEPDKPDVRTAGNPAPSFDRLSAPPGKPEPLKAAPVSDLVRNTPAGPLPIAAPDGRKAWNTYAKPFNAPAGTPRVAVVVADLGLMPAATDAAITKLPAGVTLAFSPYGFDIPQAMQRAREAGHEVMMALPMEDRGFPAHDPGPLGLNSLLPANDNLIRLNTILTKGVGYVGLLGRGGATFTAKPELMKPVLDTIARSGLLYLQPSSGVQLASYGQIATPTAVVDLTLDERPFRAAIDARLRALEALAKERGSAVAVISPTPLAFDAVSSWLAEAQARGIALAPVSAVVRP